MESLRLVAPSWHFAWGPELQHNYKEDAALTHLKHSWQLEYRAERLTHPITHTNAFD